MTIQASHVAFNHVGQCVTDLERSRRFYCELLEFTFDREIKPRDDLSAKLLGLPEPLGMTAVYLERTAWCSSCCTSPPRGGRNPTGRGQ